jgi:hypothetical protein
MQQDEMDKLEERRFQPLMFGCQISAKNLVRMRRALHKNLSIILTQSAVPHLLKILVDSISVTAQLARLPYKKVLLW